ncbi:MAG TPA: ATP-binding protein [Vicinamibacterales bacterium]|jgi:signal transduction histidine kinase/CheY-like chemotaxis protein|nr:ATP-binding protein [Vicinamibacterales bacterium]
MTPFRDLPIRRKLLLLTLATTGAALLVASTGFLTWDIVERRREIKEDVEAESQVLPESMAASITFDRPEEVERTLALLEIRPHVRFACAYKTNGQRVGSYSRNRERCPAAPPAESSFGWNTYEIRSDITYEGDHAGIFYMSRDMADVHRRLAVGTSIILALLILAVSAALALARRMQRSVSEPLLDLADIARRISASRDYSIRAAPMANDEIGVVVRSFNEMLDQIADRTAELSKANAELKHEIVERKKVERDRIAALERERDANRLKDEFLATLSHELRTPMNAVLGWARVLRSTGSDVSTHERGLESIERNARAQARLIEDLLEVSRIVTGKLRLQVHEVDLAAIVDTAVDNVRPAAIAKRLRLDTQIDARPALTTGDPDRLQQVVWNLLSNAVKFTPPEGQVTVTLVQRDGFVLTVQDSGPGIEPKFLPYVFDAFRQADGSATREHGGLGLGLAIAKQLVEAHGGTIRAQSTGKDQGARFEVFLPSVVDTRKPAAADLPDPDALDASLLTGVDVLVVDDDEDARLLMQMTLSRYGAAVTTAGSAHEALAVLDRSLPDVVLSDIGMPHEDGYDLLRRLRSRPAERGGTIPAVAVTAYASTTDRSSTLAAGYQGHVAKPFEPGEVARLVRRLVTPDQTVGRSA